MQLHACHEFPPLILGRLLRPDVPGPIATLRLAAEAGGQTAAGVPESGRSVKTSTMDIEKFIGMAPWAGQERQVAGNEL